MSDAPETAPAAAPEAAPEAAAPAAAPAASAAPTTTLSNKNPAFATQKKFKWKVTAAGSYSAGVPSGSE
eukprot:m.476642 g.476642  ORF g.476642 m.476642 type:complete len:69 (+) comp20600_c0_seq1:581-787(+)